MKNRHAIRIHSTLIVTTVLILFIALSSLLVSRRVNDIEEQRSLSSLYSEAGTLVRDINIQIERNREHLEMLATIASSFEDLHSARLWEIFASFELHGMMSDLAMLLPDGQILLRGGRKIESRESFEEISKKGAHITDREVSLISGEYILRHYVPVLRDGKTVAMLYGIIDLKTLIDDLILSPYDGEGSVYIIDANTGDFLLDTWHKNQNLGNFWDMGERPVAKGYDSAAFQRELFRGDKGHIVFQSRTTGDYLYYHYQDAGVNEWRLALSVPESIVFSYATEVRRIMNFFLILEALAFFSYFLWLFHYVRRESGEKQRQVDALNNVYNVSKLLFGAHEKKENIKPALMQIARNTESSRALFLAAKSKNEYSIFSSSSEDKMPDYIPFLKDLFENGGVHYESYDDSLEGVTKEGLKSLAAIPLEDERGGLCGILALENPKKKGDVISMLRSVSLPFCMLCRNLWVYRSIRQNSETDSLTGLLNRNRYEMDITHFTEWYESSLSCIYIDANGLHDLNNTKGHEAGDDLLQKIADAIKKYFGKRYSYRIGGDEFVSFIPDMSYKDVSSLARDAERYLISIGIPVAIGLTWKSGRVEDISSLVRMAEKEMYSSKKSYYESISRDSIR